MRATRLLVEAVLGLSVMMIASPLTDALRKEVGSLPVATWVKGAGAASTDGPAAGAAGGTGLPDQALQQVMTLEPSSLAMLGLIIAIVGLRLLRKTLGV